VWVFTITNGVAPRGVPGAFRSIETRVLQEGKKGKTPHCDARLHSYNNDGSLFFLFVRNNEFTDIVKYPPILTNKTLHA